MPRETGENHEWLPPPLLGLGPQEGDESPPLSLESGESRRWHPQPPVAEPLRPHESTQWRGREKLEGTCPLEHVREKLQGPYSAKEMSPRRKPYLEEKPEGERMPWKYKHPSNEVLSDLLYHALNESASSDDHGDEKKQSHVEHPSGTAMHSQPQASQDQHPRPDRLRK